MKFGCWLGREKIFSVGSDRKGLIARSGVKSWQIGTDFLDQNSTTLIVSFIVMKDRTESIQPPSPSKCPGPLPNPGQLMPLPLLSQPHPLGYLLDQCFLHEFFTC